MMKKPRQLPDEWLYMFVTRERDYYKQVAEHYEKALQLVLLDNLITIEDARLFASDALAAVKATV